MRLAKSRWHTIREGCFVTSTQYVGSLLRRTGERLSPGQEIGIYGQALMPGQGLPRRTINPPAFGHSELGEVKT